MRLSFSIFVVAYLEILYILECWNNLVILLDISYLETYMKKASLATWIVLHCNAALRERTIGRHHRLFLDIVKGKRPLQPSSGYTYGGYQTWWLFLLLSYLYLLSSLYYRSLKSKACSSILQNGNQLNFKFDGGGSGADGGRLGKRRKLISIGGNQSVSSTTF